LAERPQPRGFDVNQPGSTLETFKGLAQGATTDLVSIPQETLAAATSVASELDPRLLATSPISSVLSAADPYVQDFVEKFGMQALGEMIYGKAPTEELQQIRDDARLIGGIAGLGELATLKASKGIGGFAKFLKKDPPPRIEPTINLPPGFSQGPQIETWHGTAEDFPKFNMRYVGTGEGNQMFGHGIYTSDLRVIGTEYRDNLGFRPTLSGDGETMAERALNKFEPTRIRDVEGSPFGRFIEDDDDYADILDAIIESDDKISTRTSLTDQATVIEFKDGSALRTQNAEKIIDEEGTPIFEGGVLDYLTKEPVSGNFIQPLGKSEGTLMKVGVNVNPQEDLLDFYRRLSEQPTEVQRKIKTIAEKIGNKDLIKNLQNADGQGVQDAIAKYLGVQYQSPKVSELFNEFGIKGMKYSTQGTRQAKLKPEEDKYNYVIFDDSVLEILKKYGVVGPVTLTAARGAVSEPEEKEMKDGGIVTLADVARNTGRGPMGVASLSSTARNMNRPMVS